MARKKITHVIFDYDGTLVDSIEKMQIVISEIIEKKGKKVTPEILGKHSQTRHFKFTNLSRECSEFVFDGKHYGFDQQTAQSKL